MLNSDVILCFLQSFVSYTRLAVQRAEDMSPPVLGDGTTVTTATPTSDSESLVPAPGSMVTGMVISAEKILSRKVAKIESSVNVLSSYAFPPTL